MGDAGQMTVGDRIKQARTAAKLTRVQLAEQSGVPYPTLAGLENGDQKSSTALPALAQVLGVTALWLASGRGSMRPIHHAEPVAQPSGLDVTASQFGRPNPATMLAAVDLLAFDEEQAGPYTVKGRTRRLLDLYDRITADGGEELSSDSNRQFEAEVQARALARKGEQKDGKRRKKPRAG